MDPIVRRELRDGDAEAIVELHRRVYAPEYGLNGTFLQGVRHGLERAIAAGWPSAGGAVWLLDGGGVVDGALGLTDEGSGVGRVRWFLLAPALRGRGLGKGLVAELLGVARAQGMKRLELETFSALRAAAKLYREVGFEVTWQRQIDTWGPPVTYQHYDLEL